MLHIHRVRFTKTTIQQSAIPTIKCNVYTNFCEMCLGQKAIDKYSNYMHTDSDPAHTSTSSERAMRKAGHTQWKRETRHIHSFRTSFVCCVLARTQNSPTSYFCFFLLFFSFCAIIPEMLAIRFVYYTFGLLHMRCFFARKLKYFPVLTRICGEESEAACKLKLRKKEQSVWCIACALTVFLIIVFISGNRYTPCVCVCELLRLKFACKLRTDAIGLSVRTMADSNRNQKISNLSVNSFVHFASGDRTGFSIRGMRVH